jgi:hypothetical protein
VAASLNPWRQPISTLLEIKPRWEPGPGIRVVDAECCCEFSVNPGFGVFRAGCSIKPGLMPDRSHLAPLITRHETDLRSGRRYQVRHRRSMDPGIARRGTMVFATARSFSAKSDRILRRSSPTVHCWSSCAWSSRRLGMDASTPERIRCYRNDVRYSRNVSTMKPRTRRQSCPAFKEL